ncbi:MAG: sugar phosphate isomerase/epimerase [bacterium]
MKKAFACLLLAVLAPHGGLAASTNDVPKLYAYCVQEGDAMKRALPEEARLLRELGYDGGGYPLWLGETLDANLKVLDEAGLPAYLFWVALDLRKPLDPQVLSAVGRLKGRPATVSVLLAGFPAGDPQGMEPAVQTLRQLGDAAAANGVRVSIYHHVGNWTESLPFTVEVVRKANHPQVGFNFNLCHWLKVNSAEDYRPLLKAQAGKLYVVTLNGATVGAATWTNGLIRPLDEGDFDNRQLLATLREIGYRGPVGLMCFGVPGDARDHLTRSMATWRKLTDQPPTQPK